MIRGLGRSTRALVAAGLCLAVLLGAVAWISVTVLRLDRSESEMRRQAVIEENRRLALWRLDSALAPLVLRESMRPGAQYRSRFPASEHVRLNFRMAWQGGGSDSWHGESTAVTSPQGESPQLDRLRALVRPDRIAAALDASPTEVSDGNLEVARQAGVAQAPQVEPAEHIQQAQRAQQAKSSVEWVKRAQSLGNAYANNYANQNRAAADGADGFGAGAAGGLVDGLVGRDGGPRAGAVRPMSAVWVAGELFLARRLDAGAGQVIEGCWLDWPELESWLREQIADLLPDARLAPVPSPAEAGDTVLARSLASLPIELVAGAAVPPGAAGQSGSPVAWILVVVWCAVLLAAGAVVTLLGGIAALSERRAAFVAAVTHELRTPLTTLQTYSEMLVDGKVTSPNKRTRYLETLQREALRLGHLVENVLSYSRIERGRDGVRSDRIGVQALLDRAFERLANPAGEAEMDLQIEVDPDAGALEFIGDETAVEHIVFNLVDNACKYAAGSADDRIVISARQGPGTVELRVRDHGPGVPEDVRKRLFTPFSKSVQRAATSAPGVGLGLALSRRLARAMGGELRLDESPRATGAAPDDPAGDPPDDPTDAAPGSCFVLALPRPRAG